MRNDFEWSQHTLDVAYLRNSQYASDFVKVQVSDVQIWLLWMTGTKFSNKSEKEHIISLMSVTYMDICSVNNVSCNVPLKSFYSKMLTLFQNKNKWGKTIINFSI